jgi:hypothetical protein
MPNNTGTPLDASMPITAAETGIPIEDLWNLRASELIAINEFVATKIQLHIARNQKERDRLLAEQEAWLNMHPLWRAHLEGKATT